MERKRETKWLRKEGEENLKETCEAAKQQLYMSLVENNYGARISKYDIKNYTIADK